MGEGQINRPLFNGLALFFSLLAWIACNLVFGGALFSSKYTYTIEARDSIKLTTQFFYGKLKNKFLGTVSYGDYPMAIYADTLDPEKVAEACASVSNPFIVTIVFSWLFIFFGIFLQLFRWGGCHTKWPCINSYDAEMLLEIAFMVVGFIFYAVGSLIYTGGCFAVVAKGSTDFKSLYPTGLVFVWIMLLAYPLILYWLWKVRQDTKGNPPVSNKSSKATTEISSTFSSVGTVAVRVEEPPPSREIPGKRNDAPPPAKSAPAKTSPPPPAKSSVPPPSAPAKAGAGGKWKVGDDCQAVWSEDGAWYRAKITAAKGGGKYSVLFTEYNQSGEVTEDQIKPVPAPRRQ